MYSEIDKKVTRWPIFVVKAESGNLYYFDISWGNRHGTGEGWLCAIPWGEQRKSGGICQSDNRVSIDPDYAEVDLLGWTRRLEDYVEEYGEPICLTP